MCYIEPRDVSLAEEHKLSWNAYKSELANITRNPQNDSQVDGLITLDEVWDAIEQTQKDKAPGPDGVTYEMLKALPECVVKDIRMMFQFAHSNTVCPEVWHQAIIAPSIRRKMC